MMHEGRVIASGVRGGRDWTVKNLERVGKDRCGRGRRWVVEPDVPIGLGWVGEGMGDFGKPDGDIGLHRPEVRRA